MNTFFDLREFLITILRKAKFCIILTAICAICGGAIRLIPLMKEYLTYTPPTVETNQTVTADFPYRYQSRRTLYIEPLLTPLEDTVIDNTSLVINAYLACYQNKEILQSLIDKYYTEAANDFFDYNQRLVEYNYRTKNILDKPFNLTDFYGIVTIRVIDQTETSSGNYINIYATTANEDLSERIVTDAEQLLSQYVKDLVGKYSYTVTEGQIGIQTPQASDGLIPKDLTNNVTVVQKRPELSFIIMRGVKGVIWGIAGGIGFSIILCFFFNCLSAMIVSENDLSVYGVPVIASIQVKKKKHFLGFIDTWIDRLEGNSQNCESYQLAAALVSSYIDVFENKDSTELVVTGAGSDSGRTAFTDAFENLNTNRKIYTAGCICTTAETVRFISKSDGVILFEELRVSNKQEIQKEIDRIHLLGKTVYGIVLQK